MIKDISADEAKNLIDTGGLLVLDVRSKEEFAKNRIEGSLNIPIDEIEERFKEIEAYLDKPILVYCLSGSRSIIAAEILESKGFKQLVNMTHGLMEWRMKQFPLKNGN